MNSVFWLCSADKTYETKPWRAFCNHHQQQQQQRVDRVVRHALNDWKQLVNGASSLFFCCSPQHFHTFTRRVMNCRCLSEERHQDGIPFFPCGIFLPLPSPHPIKNTRLIDDNDSDDKFKFYESFWIRWQVLWIRWQILCIRWHVLCIWWQVHTSSMNLMASSISYPRSVTVTKPCVHNEKRRLSKPAFQGGLTFVLRAEPSDRTPQQRQTNSTKAHTFRFRPLCIRVRQFVDTWALHNTYDPHTIYLMNMKQFVVALSLFPIKVL